MKDTLLGNCTLPSGAVLTAATGSTVDLHLATLTLADGQLAIAKTSGLQSALDAKAPAARTVNGHALTGDVTVTKGDVGLGSVDNTSDANKPVSTAQAAAIAVEATNRTAADTAALAALIEREGVRFDGTTPSGATITGGGIPAVGTGDFTFAIAMTPKSILANTGLLGTLVGIPSALGVKVSNVNGTLTLTATNVSEGAASNAGLVVVDSPCFIGVTRSAGTATFYRNSVSWGGGADSQSFSAATHYLMGEGNYGITPNCECSRALFFNYALTQSELLALQSRGLVTLPEQRGGSMVGLTTGDSSTFTSGVGNWTAINGGAISASGGKMLLTGTGVYDGAQITSIVLERGRRYRVSATLSAPISGQTYLSVGDTGGAILLGLNMNATTQGEFTAVNTAVLAIFHSWGGGGGCSVDDFTITPLGTLFEMGAASAGHGPVIRDGSGNGRHLLLPGDGVNGGAARIAPYAGEQEIGPFDIAGTGNFEPGGADVRRIPGGYAVVGASINAAASSTGNVTLGTSSGGAQIVASTAVSTGVKQVLTVVNPSPVSPARIWVGLSGTLTAGSLLWLRIAPTN